MAAEEGQAKCAQIDLDGRRVGMRYPVDAQLIGDAKETLRELNPLLERKEDRGWRGRSRTGREWWRVVEDRAMLDADPMNPQRVVWELYRVLPDDAILAADSGSSTNWWARDLRSARGCWRPSRARWRRWARRCRTRSRRSSPTRIAR